MSSRPAARGSEAARSIRLALRTSSMVAVSSASPSRCFLFWPGRRARIASLIVLATVAIPPTTQPHPLPIRPHAPRRRLGCAAQETMGGEQDQTYDRLGSRSVHRRAHGSGVLMRQIHSLYHAYSNVSNYSLYGDQQNENSHPASLVQSHH